MTPAQMIERIARCGLHLAADGSDIVVTPAGRLTDPQKQWIRRHKDELLEVLRQPGRLIDDQGGNDLPAANDQANPITLQVWTPAGDPVRVKARDQDHADFIKRMNPGPGMVRCADCQHATISAGIARCQAGVESGLPIQGFWAPARHLCAEFQGKPAKSGSAQNSDPIPEKSASPEPHRATKTS